MNETGTVQVEITENRAVVTGTGELDLTIGSEFDEALARAVEKSKQVTVDFTGADFIDSAILQSLAINGRQMYDRGTRLKVIFLSKSYVEYVLRTVGFDALMDFEAKPAPDSESGET